MPSQQKIKILTIDDDISIRISFVAYLEDCGYQVFAADNGKDGLQLFRQESPDVVLVDLRMPGLDGFAVLDAIKAESPDTPAIVISGTALLQDAVKALRQGASDYLIKPVQDLELLSHCIERALESVRMKKELRMYHADLENEVRRRTYELEIARNDAEAACEAKSQFLSNMSHELRTPLNGILGLSELMLMSVPENASEDHIEYLNLVRQSGAELLKIVNNILDLSSIESDQITLKEAPFSLREAMETVVQTLDIQARWKNLSLELQCDSIGVNSVVGDAERVKHIVSHLVVNAIKHTEIGGVTVSVQTEKANDDSVATIITVTDTGVGISEEKLGKIFEPFALGESFLTKKRSGVGVGLSLAREFARRMGGDIVVDSQEGAGSEFFVSLKLQSAEQPCKETDAILPLVSDVPLKVLVAEHDAISRKLTKYYFEKRGNAVTCVSSGHEALEALLKDDFDLLLLDIELADASGLEVLRTIREAKSKSIASELPIILLVHDPSKVNIAQMRLAGASAHVNTPVDFTVLDSTLAQVISNR